MIPEMKGILEKPPAVIFFFAVLPGKQKLRKKGI